MTAPQETSELACSVAGQSFAPARGYAAVEHACCVCAYRWNSPDKKTAQHVENATKVNKEGPYCILCLHLEMAARYAEHRGYVGVRNAMTAWRRHNDKAQRRRDEPKT